MPRVDVEISIRAPLHTVWQAVNSIEDYPEFMDNVRAVQVKASAEGERVSFWSVLLKGSVLEWTEREWVDHAHHRITFEQVDGDLDKFAGYWKLREQEPGTVAVQLSVDFEIGIPLLSEMLNPVASRAIADNSVQMLREIERRVASP